MSSDQGPVNRLSVMRSAFDFGYAYAVTDYHTQGQSFKKEPLVMHINPPPDRHLKRPNLMVPISRHPRMSAINMLVALWRAYDVAARDAIIDVFNERARVVDDLASEIRRLQSLTAQTKLKYADVLMRIGIQLPTGTCQYTVIGFYSFFVELGRVKCLKTHAFMQLHTQPLEISEW